jgi:hypothetical protein
VVLVGHGRPEQRHDPVAHDLVDGALVAVDRFHHPLDDRVQDLPGFLRVAVSEQFQRSFEVGEETVTCLRSPSRAALAVRIFWARCLGV